MHVDRTCVFYTHTIPPSDLEAWVRAIASESGQQVVWHIDRGVHLFALGDILKVVRAMLRLRGQHDAAFRKASRLRPELAEQALEWIWAPVLQIEQALEGVVTVSLFTEHPRMEAPKPVPMTHPRAVGQGDSFCASEGSTVFSVVFSASSEGEDD